jgi:hypothetical protein
LGGALVTGTEGAFSTFSLSMIKSIWGSLIQVRVIIYLLLTFGSESMDLPNLMAHHFRVRKMRFRIVIYMSSLLFVFGSTGV